MLQGRQAVLHDLIDRGEKSAYTGSMGLNGSALTSIVLHDKSYWTNMQINNFVAYS